MKMVKSEIRISKFETGGKFEGEVGQTKCQAAAWFKSETNSNMERRKLKTGSCRQRLGIWVSTISASNFPTVSDLGFRISDLAYATLIFMAGSLGADIPKAPVPESPFIRVVYVFAD